ncbi:hypothetical protein [Enterococcus casseliflavus]|uniref:hypothetical protein n=1 Tax=Enterococcus casseliflavus TaxID=37734 RepID=UPI003D103D82
MRCFTPVKELEKTTTEKGKPKESDVLFPAKSQFRYIQDNFRDSDFLICDDLGNEIADFITITDGKGISFYHAKSDHTKTLSATAFHIVVSQAEKNLGSVINVDNMNLQNKKKLWSKKFPTTNIPRLISRVENKTSEDAIKMLEKNSSGIVTKKVCLVVDFISKEKLKKELGKEHIKSEALQILWLLASFITICDELNVTPEILCKP